MKKLIFLLLTIISLSCVYPRVRFITGWPFMLGGFFSWLFIIAIIAVLIYLLIERDKLVKKSGGETPIEILKRRYAKGEITKKQYDKMKKELET